jgi:hypothetical protein
LLRLHLWRVNVDKLEEVGHFVKGAVEEGLANSIEFEDVKLVPGTETPSEINFKVALKTGEAYDVVITRAQPIAAGAGP